MLGWSRRGGRLSFAKEASLLILIAKDIRREEREGDTAPEASMLGLVDNTHPARNGH